MSQIPPTFEGARPRKSPTTIIVVIVLACLFFCALCAVGGGIMFWNLIKNTGALKLSGCLIDFSNVSHAINEYASDHGGKMPDAKTWQDDVRPYYARIFAQTGSQNPFSSMKPDEDWGCETDKPGIKTGMSYNSELSGKDLASLTDWGTIELFEIDKPMRNAASPYIARPLAGSPILPKMNSPRGWMVVTVDGKARMDGNPGSFNTPATWRPKGRKP